MFGRKNNVNGIKNIIGSDDINGSKTINGFKDVNGSNTIKEAKDYLALKAENEELKYELERYKWQMEQIEKQEQEIRELHQNTRRLKHDMRNHLMVIASYINNGEYEEVKTYTSDILDRLNTVQSYVETGNQVLNHILNEKLNAARRTGIDVKAQVEKVEFAKMKGIDFAAVFGNILDNAIEASAREEKKEISIKIFTKKGYDAISVKNKITESILENNPDLNSTKAEAEAHGYGLKQVRETVEAYEGMVDFFEEDGFFCVNVFIPKKQ